MNKQSSPFKKKNRFLVFKVVLKVICLEIEGTAEIGQKWPPALKSYSTANNSMTHTPAFKLCTIVFETAVEL